MRTIDLDTLTIFRAVVREGGVIRAAATLNRVPSNVTTRIKQLEDRLSVALFQRRGRTIALTDAGRTLLEYAERLLKLADEAESATRHAVDLGRIAIGSMESTAASRLPKLLSEFHQRHPGICLTVETGTTAAMMEKVRSYRLEAAFVGEPADRSGFETRPVFRENLVLVTGRAHPKVRSPHDLSARTMLAFTAGCSYRRRLEQWLSDADVAPDAVLELASYQAILACAAAGAGFAIMPASVIATYTDASNIAVHQLPATIARNTTHLVWNGAPSPQLARLIAELPKPGKT